MLEYLEAQDHLAVVDHQAVEAPQAVEDSQAVGSREVHRRDFQGDHLEHQAAAEAHPTVVLPRTMTPAGTRAHHGHEQDAGR